MNRCKQAHGTAFAVSQDDFTRAMRDASLPIPLGLVDQDGSSAGRRFSVYRNNIAVSLREAMHSAFPVITKLLGTENMNGLSRLFLHAHPPKSPLMMFYGAEFPNFLEAQPQLSHLGYLGDVARLELAMRQAYHAADATPIAPDTLVGLSEDALLTSRLTFAPALHLLQSPWPIEAIWRFNTVPQAPAPQAGAQAVIITRPEFDPVLQLFPAAGAVWLDALQQGASIGAALQRATATDADFDLSFPLTLLLQGGAITGLERKR
ncbi:HvfC/BufC N-terminal domain-containing protein [Pseudophaeobacter flagellatus]|uniref:HvfC/BufC N-terminal domain-containing protein n=1 Tax=Pseudophaeobacter flagellatus TaxID=2899119 RepID=UPI001E4B8763|nr:DNA-binding domain-containing protein [Pseudophaeobacter flagellatus]MCD9146543.1 DNA-binding domain-containing protein [Pseudophaeobacter flagellatus]